MLQEELLDVHDYFENQLCVNVKFYKQSNTISRTDHLTLQENLVVYNLFKHTIWPNFYI